MSFIITDIETRLINQRDQMAARAFLGRVSTIADRPVRYPYGEKSLPGVSNLWSHVKAGTGKLLRGLSRSFATRNIRLARKASLLK